MDLNDRIKAKVVGNSGQNRGYKQGQPSTSGGGNRSNYNNGNKSNSQNNYQPSQSRTFTNNTYRRSNDQNVRVISGNPTHLGNGGEIENN